MEIVFLVLLFVLMIFALTSGFPVAFALPGSAIITMGLAALCGYVFAGDATAFFAQNGPVQWLNAGVTNFRSLFWVVERDTLIAIPLFVFMGIMLQRSKIAEDLLVAMAQLFGPVPGGLGISVVFVGALLAATTGIVGATVIAMGLISLPAMIRNNYSHSLACGTICASGTLGQIIPPSIVLIILADQLSSAADQANTARQALYRETTGEFSMPSQFDVVSASAGDMFMGALIPGLILVSLYMAYILITALLKPESAPPIPFEGDYDRQFLKRVLLALIPPLSLIFVVLGSIIMGVATVNQAGAIGAVGAMIMAGYRLHSGQKHKYTPAVIAIISVLALAFLKSQYNLNVKNIHTSEDAAGVTLAAIAVGFLVLSVAWSATRTYRIDKTLDAVMVETAKTTSMVFIILIGAAMLTSAFRAFGGEELVKHFLTGLPGGFWTQFLVVMLVIFLLGFFLDFIEIAVVVVPIVAPILLADPQANITAVWLGVMIGLNIQTSFLTPPFGFALFYLRGVASSAVKTLSIYKGAVAFIGLQLLALAIAGYFPALVNYMPNRTSLTSDTAPPPMNPKIQACLDKSIFNTLSQNEKSLMMSIDKASALDLSVLPEPQRSALSTSLLQAKNTFSLAENVQRSQQTLMAYDQEFAQAHHQVRATQRTIRLIKQRIKDSKDELKFDEFSPDVLAEKEQLIIEQTQNIDNLERGIPEQWKTGYSQRQSLVKKVNQARNTYTQNMDESYQTLQDLRKLLIETEALTDAKVDIAALAGIIEQLPQEDAIDLIKKASSSLSDFSQMSAVKSQLSKARKVLKKKNDKAKALDHHRQALALMAEEITWRSQSAPLLITPLAEYDGAIKGTIGIRKQDKLGRDLALEIAACQSHHTDISLNF